jgi:hypothetical protein
MASLDFKEMSKTALRNFRKQAIEAKELPSVENNYFTTPFSVYSTNKQPADWVPTKMAHNWCEQHGPSNHETAECRDSYLANFKRALKAKTSDSERLELFFESVRAFSSPGEHFCPLTIGYRFGTSAPRTQPQERRQKKAAKRKHNLAMSNKDNSSCRRQWV